MKKIRIVALLTLWIVMLSLLVSCGSEKPEPTYAASNSDSVTVYVTRTGSKYHRDGCRYLSKSQFAISLEDAKDQGYEPCSKCNPPE
jgi:hypothetical protein